MRFPAVLLLVPALVGAVWISDLQDAGTALSAGDIGMTEDNYSTQTVTVRVGEPLTFVNNSHFLHVLVPGTDARTMNQPGMPGMDDAYGTHVSETGDVYKTKSWATPGTYHLTCTLHPEMNVDVVVVP